MTIIEGIGGTVKLITFLSLFLILLAFQNCGDSARVNMILADENSSSFADDCIGLECVSPEELLWLKIREYEPYKILFSTQAAVGHFNVGGQCGTGLFENHTFLWELREGFGAQNVVGRGFADNRCYLGQFQVPISPNISPIFPDQRYQLQLELVGVGTSNEQFTNPMPSNKATLDILFLSTP